MPILNLPAQCFPRLQHASPKLGLFCDERQLELRVIHDSGPVFEVILDRHLGAAVLSMSARVARSVGGTPPSLTFHSSRLE